MLFFILFLLVKKQKTKKDGNIALLYLIFYSIIRILVETVRIDSVCYIAGIPVAIVVSIAIIAVSAIILIKNIYQNKNNIEE